MRGSRARTAALSRAWPGQAERGGHPAGHRPRPRAGPASPGRKVHGQELAHRPGRARAGGGRRAGA
eukprot:11842559-Alexandrium_andersonii.AAC.1